MRKRVTQLLLIASVVLVLDQLSKYWLLEMFELPTRSPYVINEYISLVMAWNKGVSFSMFTHDAAFMPYVLMAVAICICAILVHLHLKSENKWERVGYAMVVGGALGNVIDRARFGAVVDFLYAHIGDLGWPAFNVADSAICIGVGLLLLQLIKKPATA